MFKSRAKKQAEFLLKVEREKERLQQREVARKAARQKAAQDTQKLFKACVDGYKTAYQRYPKATLITTLVSGVFLLGIGGILSNPSESSTELNVNNKPTNIQSETPRTETVSASESTATTRWGTLHSNDGKINFRTRPGTVNKAIGYGINGDRVQILNSAQDSGGYVWYNVQSPKSGAIGWMAGQLIEMDSNTALQTETEPFATSSTQPSPSQLPKSERFRLRFYEEVDRLAGDFGIKRKYAVMTMQNWESQPEGIELGYKFTCEDMARFNGDAMAIAQFAYEVNQYSIPLDQLQVFNQAKFEAANFVGCK
jgi:type II secretory pathway pseudopilin PulG